MFRLIVNAGNIISPLCYTVLRLEPYTSCAFKCVYCYSKWYGVPIHNEPKPITETLKLFRSFIRKIRGNGLKPIPFRLSTLVDPFPPQEQHYRITEKIMAEALSSEYPLIINTKSALYAEDPAIRRFLEKLLDKGLAILQVSMPSLDEEKVRKIEPHSSPPIERLKAAESFGDAPTVLRLSPFIPYLSPTRPDEIKEFAETLKNYGVKHVIVESLRMERNLIDGFLKNLGIKVDVESYSVKNNSIAKISENIREDIYNTLSMELKRHGIGFATCKEGLFAFHTTPDCCGAYLLKDFAIRPTLYDIYRHIIEKGKAQPEEIMKSMELDATRVCGEKLKEYPKQISKQLRYHERRMLKTLRDSVLLKRVAPHLARITTQD